MEKVKTYFPYIDGLKGTAILLMVMAHTLAWSFPDYSFLSLKLCDMSINECYSAFIWKKYIHSICLYCLLFQDFYSINQENTIGKTQA